MRARLAGGAAAALIVIPGILGAQTLRAGRTLWASDAADALALELQPVGDSEETFAVWIAHCERWRRELEARIGRPVDLEWLDPDGAATIVLPRPGEADTLIYERSG